MGESSQLWLPFPEVTQLSRQAQVGHPSPTSTGTETEPMPGLQCLSDSLLWPLDDGERQGKEEGAVALLPRKIPKDHTAPNLPTGSKSRLHLGSHSLPM